MIVCGSEAMSDSVGILLHWCVVDDDDDDEALACLQLDRNPMPTHLHTSTFLIQRFYCMMSFN